MSRSKWKGPYINPKNLKDITLITKQYVYFMSRNSEIIPKFLGLTFKVHNGKNYSEISVNDSMVGHKFGEFVFTRAEFSFKKKKSKKK
jgi:small subunit ribosomal protein S19